MRRWKISGRFYLCKSKMKNLQKELEKRRRKDLGYLIPADKVLYNEVIKKMISPFKNKGINKVMAIDMKGLLYGPVIAYKLKLPFVPILKGGKVNREVVVRKEFIDYSKKKKSIEIAKISIKKGDKILLVDDFFESGKTGRTAIELIEKLGGEIKGISVIYDKLNEDDIKFFNKYNYHYLIKLK